MAQRPYPICTWIPLTFFWLFAGGTVIAVAAENSVLPELFVNLTATAAGVFLALVFEQRRERRKDREAKDARVREWLAVIRKGAASNLGLVHQMLGEELVSPTPGVSPSYRSDRILLVAMEQGAKDLLEVPGCLDAHRHAVFELAHLDKKLDLLLIAHPAHFADERLKTAVIARSAEGALLALLDKVNAAERFPTQQLHDS